MVGEIRMKEKAKINNAIRNREELFILEILLMHVLSKTEIEDCQRLPKNNGNLGQNPHRIS